MEILLVRHGRTMLNEAKKFYGSIDADISEKGIKDALDIREKLNKEYLEYVYTSTLKRTIDTCSVILLNHTFDIHNSIQVPDWNERSCGAWEGLDANEIEQRYPEVWERYLKEPLLTTPEGAESFENFKKRVIDKFERERKLWRSTDTIMLVLHQGVLRVIVKEYFENSKDYWDISFKHGEIYRYFM